MVAQANRNLLRIEIEGAKLNYSRGWEVFFKQPLHGVSFFESQEFAARDRKEKTGYYL
jgi:hypothetical protein